MGRKNRRIETYKPLDLTPPQEEHLWRKVSERQPPLTREESAERARKRNEAQRLARMKRGIDWSVCIVPGCGDALLVYRYGEHPPNRRDSDLDIPICYEHAAIIWNQLVRHHGERPEFVEAVANLNDALAQRDRREHVEQKVKRLAQTDGHMYFIRLNDLVKVGWTRDLFDRVKSYGASAVLLASYPATRDDETNLHRQLTPARAKGREWYHDGPIIQSYVAEAVAKYGPPKQFEFMWTQPKQVVAGKRHR